MLSYSHSTVTNGADNMNIYTLDRAECFDVFSRYPWIRERIVEHGSFSLQVSLTQDEFDTLVKGGVNVR